MVALVGASGSGKTTLSNLLFRFYDPVREAIKIGGVDLRDVATRDLRNLIAVVTRENILFNDTIRRNIEPGRLGATNEEIVAAANFAKAIEFISPKPEGFDTVIDEKGGSLSGGGAVLRLRRPFRRLHGGGSLSCGDFAGPGFRRAAKGDHFKIANFILFIPGIFWE